MLKDLKYFLINTSDLKDQFSVGEFSRALVDELRNIKDVQRGERTPESLARWENINELLSALVNFQILMKMPRLNNILKMFH